MYADSTEHFYQQLLNSAYYMNAIHKKLTQVYSRYPCEKPLIERVFVRTG